MFRVTVTNLKETDGGNYTCKLKINTLVNSSVAVVILPRKCYLWQLHSLLWIPLYHSLLCIGRFHKHIYLALFLVSLWNIFELKSTLKYLQVVRFPPAHQIHSSVEVDLASPCATSVMAFPIVWLMAGMKAVLIVVGVIGCFDYSKFKIIRWLILFPSISICISGIVNMSQPMYNYFLLFISVKL